jgi:LmbE family N-acetylglucosaminyl deacetylase
MWRSTKENHDPGHDDRQRMKLVVVVAHPDDETFGTGSVIARAAGDGAEVVVCCATLGERGEARPGSVAAGTSLSEVRGRELEAAAALLGARRVRVLGFQDSGWDGECGTDSLVGAEFELVVGAVLEVILEERPDVVVTMDPTGGDGHRDHVRIALATMEAFDRASLDGATLYHWCLVRSVMRRWVAHNTGTVYADVPADEFGFPDDQITTSIDVTDLIPLRWQAIRLHHSQASPYDGLPDELADAFLGTDRLVRSRPPWTGGALETRLAPS